MRLPEENLRPAEINIVPLIDVIFSILVFFIVASLVLTRAESLDVDLPEANNARQQIQPDITISITSDNQVAVNKEVVPIDQLVTKVEQILQETTTAENENQERLVLISADLAITHGKFVEVTDALRRLETFEVTFGIATQSAGS
ncbi:MAG: biopolymer transporter ExbD [Synechococcaceae cyanobacterium SM2_3_1]|nr:biopolymer transporter ExbD [Synechococcaceae cyanobacterium SM2_3_1]